MEGQAFVQEGTVEALDMRVVGRLPPEGEVDLHAAVVASDVDETFGERAAFSANRCRGAYRFATKRFSTRMIFSPRRRGPL